MKLAWFAATTIAATALLIPTSLTEAKAQILTGEKEVSIYQGENSALNKQWRDRDYDRRYDRDYNDRYDRRDRGSRYYDDVNRVYREVIGRNANDRELRYWSREIARGRSARDIRRDLAESREAAYAIDQIYRQVLGRNVDRGGLRTWQRQLAQGSNLRQVRREIERSDEARRRGDYWRR